MKKDYNEPILEIIEVIEDVIVMSGEDVVDTPFGDMVQ